MCIVICIVLFFDIKFCFKISGMSPFVGSYYRTINKIKYLRDSPPVAFDPVSTRLNKPGLKRKRLKWPWSLRRTNTFDLPFQNQKFLGRNLSPI